MPRNDDPTEALLSEFRLTSSQMQAMREDATPEEKRLNRRLDELYAAFCEMERERDAETRRADHAVAELAATRAARPADTPLSPDQQKAVAQDIARALPVESKRQVVIAIDARAIRPTPQRGSE
jgi:predicted nuclease of restriction endonuclease-like RecB superfamily